MEKSKESGTKIALIIIWIAIVAAIFVISAMAILLLKENKSLKAKNKELEQNRQEAFYEEQKSEQEMASKENQAGEGEDLASSEKVEFSTQDQKQEEAAAPVQSNQKIVAIDPGHQGWNVDMSAQEPVAPGSSKTKAKATSGTSGNYSDLPEYQLNLDVSLKLRDELVKRGYQVLMTREDNDTAISNSERAKLAAEGGADIFIRIHADGEDGGSSVSGGRTMISTANNPYVGELYEESKTLAECVLDGYCKATGFKKLSIIETDTMSGINWSQVPVTILEMGYMSNKHDDLYMADEKNQFIMARGIADGVDQYFASLGKEER
ncbi:MAG: N-acetylmuramoyl-L-alanine amidase [Lachnospiraceae bacterium]